MIILTAIVIAYNTVVSMMQLIISFLLVLALMAKLDIQHAFRLIPVRPVDWPLLGYQVNDLCFFDIVLPFGLRSSPFLFCQLSESVLWILRNITGIQTVLCYADDFLLLGPSHCDTCLMLINKLSDLCTELGVPLATEKDRRPFCPVDVPRRSARFSLTNNQSSSFEVQRDMCLAR